MRRKKEDGWIVVKNTLCTIAMMYIPIDNRHVLNLGVVPLSVTGCHRNVIEETKTHRPLSGRVMTRRTNRYKGIVDLATHYQINCLTRSSSPITSGIKRTQRNHCIGVKVTRALTD